MILYLDSSAVVKLVQREPETNALREFLDEHRADELASSALAGVEVVRAVLAGGEALVSAARRQVGRLNLVTLDSAVLEDAATLSPTVLMRSLDAIHLASARRLGAELRALVTYDRRQAAGAAALRLPVLTPVDE